MPAAGSAPEEGLLGLAASTADQADSRVQGESERPAQNPVPVGFG